MNGVTLKILACVFMLIDHVTLHIEGVPVWFHWIGRLAFPLFAFILAWSCDFIRSRMRLLSRLMRILTTYRSAGCSIFAGPEHIPDVVPNSTDHQHIKERKPSPPHTKYHFLYHLSVHTVYRIMVLLVLHTSASSIHISIPSDHQRPHRRHHRS